MPLSATDPDRDGQTDATGSARPDRWAVSRAPTCATLSLVAMFQTVRYYS